MHRTRSMLLSLLLPAALISGLPARAADEAPAGVEDLGAFEQLVVLSGGRKMPMDSFARNKLLQIAGKTTFDRDPALRWLARVFFDPGAADQDAVFLINHPQVVHALGLGDAPRGRYTYAQLEPAWPKLRELSRSAAHMEPQQRSVVENEILRVAHNMNEFTALRSAFAFTQPNAAFAVQEPLLREAMDVPAGGGPPSLLDLVLALPRAAELISSLEAEGRADASAAVAEEAGRLSAEINRRVARHRGMPPEMIPVGMHAEEIWISPWDAVSLAPRRPDFARNLEQLGALASAYRAGSALEFNMAARAFDAAVREEAQPDRQLAQSALEVRYNRLDPFYRSEVLYGLAFLLGLSALVSGRRGLRLAALGVLALGLLPHTAGILMRMAIMGRPPVTNLYSTFLFVAWVAVLLCIVMEWVQKNSLGVFAGGIAGLSMLLLSRRFVSMSDPLGVLVAVLDSNFWLTTHVVTITMGYAGCVLAGLIGHFYLVQAIVKPADRARLRSLYNALFAVLGFGLTFSFLGTMLGGVWADQSWGRFWGWDPKENGALLIVLWCAILFHARVSGMIGNVGMAAGSIFGIIVVMFAWMGVNLLGVGLHSYGFTSGVAFGLFVYSGAQIAVMAALAVLARRRMRAVGVAVS